MPVYLVGRTRVGQYCQHRFDSRHSPKTVPNVINNSSFVPNEPSGDPKIDNHDELKALVEADDIESSAALATAYKASTKTISIY